MATDRVDRTIANHRIGALTDTSACLEVLIAAGEGDAEAVFSQLPPELRDVVARHVADADANDARIVESFRGTDSSEAHTVDLRRREELVRRGIVALRSVIAAWGGDE